MIVLVDDRYTGDLVYLINNTPIRASLRILAGQDFETWPRSTASFWVRDIPLDHSAERRIRKREHAQMMAEARWAEYRDQRDQQRAEAVQAASAMAGGKMSRIEVLRHGALIYWCEGAKSKPWNPQDRVVFINSDPGLISFFLVFLREAGVEQERIQFLVHIHESADVTAAVTWWAQHVGVSPESFMPTVLKRHNPKTFRQNTGENYRGCLVIRVRKSRELYWMIEGIVAGALNTVLQHSGRLRDARG